MEEEKVQPSNVMTPASLGLELDVVPESNPMLNSVVLQNLFKIVPLEDLKNMRGVCKLWWGLSLPVVRSNSRICINGFETNIEIEEITHKYEDYMALISPTEDDKFGFLRHPFEDFFFSWGNDEGEVLEFCTLFGLQIKRLTLFEGFFLDNQLQKIIFELLPNLESLFLWSNQFLKEKQAVEMEFPVGDQDQQSVCACNVQPSEKMKVLDIDQRVHFGESWKFPMSWLEIFQHYPALTTLVLQGIETGLESDSSTDFEKLLLAMKTVSKNTGRKWKIEKLDILQVQLPYALPTLFTPIVLSYLRELEFPLCSLAISVVNEEGELEVLNMYSPILQELFIYSLYSNFDFLNNIRLDSLSKLHVIGEKSRDLKFLKSMPNLKTLWIEDGNNLDCNS